MEQVLFEDTAEYLNGMIGLGKKGTVKVFRDHIEMTKATGESLANFPISTITSVSHASGVLRIRTGEQLHVFTFFVLPYRFFGLIGLMLSGAGKKAKAMAAALEQSGVTVEKKLI